MTYIKFNAGRCKGCELCVRVCPLRNIKMSADYNSIGVRPAQLIDEAKCNKCGLCFHICPDMVIEIEK